MSYTLFEFVCFRRLAAVGAAAVAATLLTVDPAAAQRRYPVVNTIPIGPWTVTSNNDQSGKFAHCELTRRDGTLTMGLTRGKAGYVFLLVDETWTGVKGGAKYDLQLEGAGLPARKLAATSVDSGVISVIGPDLNYINQLKRLRTLNVRTAQTVITVSMDMADAALTELETCWVQNSGSGSSANPFSAPAPAANSANPFAPR